MAWCGVFSGGPRRVNHSVVLLRETLMVSFGGFCSGDDHNYSTSRIPIQIHVFDTNRCKWHEVIAENESDSTEVPFQRYGHSVVAWNNQALLWGGRNNEMGSNTVHVFDLTTRRWTMPKVTGSNPGKRDGHSACIINDKMYIFGGFEDDHQVYASDLSILDLKGGVWRNMRCPSMETGFLARWECRDFHTAIARGDQMIVYGGRCDLGGDVFTNRDIYDERVYSFDTVSEQWTVICHPVGIEMDSYKVGPIGRRSHSAFLFGKFMYIFGGYNSNCGRHYRDIYRFDFDRQAWSRVSTVGYGPFARRRQSACVVGPRVFIFGGTSPKAHHEDENYEDDLLEELSDTHILEIQPSLKTLCMIELLGSRVNLAEYFGLPRQLRAEMETYARGKMSRS